MKRFAALMKLLMVLGFVVCFAAPLAAADEPAALSAAELDSLMAPIALYPDALIAQILTAATYSLEVVKAAHWLDDPYNAALKGDALATALQNEDWDLSVKSLVPFPDTLRMMEHDVAWTERVGDAFLAQQSEVMDSIQRLRKLAVSSGTLRSTPEQIVRNDDDEFVVEPASPDLVYVPYYDPFVVYGAWPWVGYTPYVFSTPPGIYVSGPAIVFGIGFAISRPLWGWSYWRWRQHDLYIPPNVEPGWHLRPGPWRHDPDHRHGVPYRDSDRGPTRSEHPVLPGIAPGPRAPSPLRPGEGRPPPRDRPAEHARPGTKPPEGPPGSKPSPRDDSVRMPPRRSRPRLPAGPSKQATPPAQSGAPRSRPPGETKPPTSAAPRPPRAIRPRPTPPPRAAAARDRESPRKPQ